MYKSFSIRRFKLFSNFRIEGFQRVNLITGRNNTGKTALLEALFIHSGAVNVSLPFNIEGFRGVSQFEGGLEVAFADLFSDFDTAQAIELEATDKLDIGRMCILKIVQAPITLEQPLPQEALAAHGQALQLAFIDPSQPKPISTRATIENGKLRIEPLPIPPLYQGVFISTRSATDHDNTAKRLSEVIKIPGEEERFVRALKVIEPSIRAIRLLSHGGVLMLHADIGMNKFLPLAYVGEGMGRLSSILASIAASRNGVVFIDEFENGFHYAILPPVWNAISEFAEKFNTQVFATTHSEECIRAAHSIFSSREYAFRLFRLFRAPNGSVQASVFDKEALEAALKSGLETR